jgi:hypothetical protein
MSKITQKELLQEGFLDTIRQAAGKITKPLARVTAGALGGVGKAALQVGKDIVTGNTGATLSNVARQGVSGAVNAYKSERDKQIIASPERFVENELKTKWNNTFNPNSIKITSSQKEEIGRTSVARHSEETPRTFVYFEASKYNKTTGNSTQQIGGVTQLKGVATVIKGSDGKFNIIEIKDEDGNTINQGAQQTIPNLNDLMNKLNFNINNSTAGKWAVALKRSFRNALPDPRKDIDKLIPAAVNNDNYVLTSADVTILRQYLKDEMLISEKNTQKDLLVQLKLLNDSYKSINNIFYIK